MTVEEQITAEPVDVVLDDQLACTYAARSSNGARAAATGMDETDEFVKSWTERGGVGEGDSDDDKDDDDIGDRLRDDGRYLANRNRDITRLLTTARLIYAEDPDRLDLQTGHKMVLLDRTRRVKFGYKKPRPMTLAQGLDGGVNICLYQARRSRPDEDVPGPTKALPPGRIAPRHRAATGTACAGVAPDAFSVKRAPWPAAVGRASGVVSVTKKTTTTTTTTTTTDAAARKTQRLQRALAEYLLRQPFDTAAYAAVRHI